MAGYSFFIGVVSVLPEARTALHFYLKSVLSDITQKTKSESEYSLSLFAVSKTMKTA